jgi:hypothetical protein
MLTKLGCLSVFTDMHILCYDSCVLVSFVYYVIWLHRSYWVQCLAYCASELQAVRGTVLRYRGPY